MKILQHSRLARSGLGVVSVGLPILLFILLSFLDENFFTAQNITNVNNQITALLIVALGQLFVALVGGIDISVGSVISLCSVLIVTVDPAFVVPVVLLTALVIGLINGLGVSLFGVHPLIMTLGSMIFVQGLALLLMSGAGGTVPPALVAMSKSTIGWLPVSAIWCVGAISITALILNKTRLGMRIYAIGADEQSAAFSGINVTALRTTSYVLCALAGGAAALYLTGRIATGDPTLGRPFSLDSVTAIALGGVLLSGGVGGASAAVLGTITLGLIANGINILGISPFYSQAITGLLLLMAVSFQRRKVIGI